MSRLAVSVVFEGNENDIRKAAAATVRSFREAVYLKLEESTPLSIRIFSDDAVEEEYNQQRIGLEVLDGLGVSAYNILKNMGVNTLGDLVRVDANAIIERSDRSSARFTYMVLEEIRSELEKFGLKLRGE